MPLSPVSCDCRACILNHMTKFIFAGLLALLPFNSQAAFQCNEELLKIVVAGCENSHTACGVRGIQNILAGRSVVEIIHNMCTHDGRQPKPEQKLALHDCVGNALKASSDPKLKMIPNHCAAKHKHVGIGSFKIRHEAAFDKCNRVELAKLLPKRANGKPAGAQN